MDVHHQVPPCCVLHHKTNVLLRLETGEKVDQERVADAVDGFEDPLLAHQAVRKQKTVGGQTWDDEGQTGPLSRSSPVHLISSHDVSFLQSFDSKHLSCAFIFC